MRTIPIVFWIFPETDFRHVFTTKPKVTDGLLEVIDKSFYDQATKDLEKAIEGYNKTIGLLKEFQELFRQGEPEMTKMIRENESLKAEIQRLKGLQ